MAARRKKGVRQKELSAAINGIVDRLAMARAVLVMRMPDGTDMPVGAVISMVDLARLEPSGQLDVARAALDEAILADQDGKPAQAHLITCCQSLIKVLGVDVT